MPESGFLGTNAHARTALATAGAISTWRPALGHRPQGATGNRHPHNGPEAGHVATPISQTKTADDRAGIGTQNTWFQRLSCSQLSYLLAPAK